MEVTSHVGQVSHVGYIYIPLILLPPLPPPAPLLSSGGPVEKPSDDWGPHLLQFPGGSWNGVPGLQEGVSLTHHSLLSWSKYTLGNRHLFYLYVSISIWANRLETLCGCSGIYNASLTSMSPTIVNSMSAFIKMMVRCICIQGLPGCPAMIAARP